MRRSPSRIHGRARICISCQDRRLYRRRIDVFLTRIAAHAVEDLRWLNTKLIMSRAHPRRRVTPNPGPIGWRARSADVILASGVIGTAISFYFQGRSWQYQTGTATIEKDSAAVLTALESLDKLIDEKWLSTYGMNDAIKTKTEGEQVGRGGQAILQGEQRLGASAQHPGVEL